MSLAETQSASSYADRVRICPSHSKQGHVCALPEAHTQPHSDGLGATWPLSLHRQTQLARPQRWTRCCGVQVDVAEQRTLYVGRRQVDAVTVHLAYCLACCPDRARAHLEAVLGGPLAPHEDGLTRYPARRADPRLLTAADRTAKLRAQGFEVVELPLEEV